MSLKEVVKQQVRFMGRTPGGCKLVLRDLLDHGRDVFQFMQLFTTRDVDMFYLDHEGDITRLCNEDEELLTEASVQAWVKLALEKCLILIERDMKVMKVTC